MTKRLISAGVKIIPSSDLKVVAMSASGDSTGNYFGQDRHMHTIIERWAKVVDIYRYLFAESRIKEKEWGWKWRDLFYGQVQKEVELIQKYGIKHEALELDPTERGYNPLKIIGAVIKAEFSVVLKAGQIQKLSLVERHLDNLEQFEISTFYLRSLLKRRSLDDLLDTRPDLRRQFQNQFDQMTLNRSIDELDLSGNVIE